MKVLITTGIYPPDIGGPARIIERIAADLCYRGIEVSVLAFGRDGGERCPFRVEKVLSKKDFFVRLCHLGRRADIIYTFDLYTAGFLSWLVGKKFLGKKLVVRFAGDSAWELTSGSGQTRDDIVTFQKKYYSLRVALLKLARRLILVGADKVVAVSGFMKDLAVTIGVPGERIKVIYNSVDFVDVNAAHRPNPYIKLGLENNKIILTAGRLVSWKGVDGLIEAMTALKNDFPDLCLVVVGDGPEKDQWRNLARNKNVVEKVKFVGQVPLDDIFDYYRWADVFVLNSQYEGLSHVLLEVLRLGKPVVASNCGGNPEVIENEKNGLLVEYNNAEQIAAAIKRMFTEVKWHSPEYQDVCRESLKKFNWQNVVNQTVEVLTEVSK